nr:hypothetical protein [uncultured Arsenicibacter sp.]
MEQKAEDHTYLPTPDLWPPLKASDLASQILRRKTEQEHPANAARTPVDWKDEFEKLIALLKFHDL